MRTKQILARAAAGAAALIVVGGCAAQQAQRLEPKLELRSAAQHLADAKQAGFTVKLTGSADDLIKGLDVPADETDVVRKLFASSVTLGYDGDRARLAATVGDIAGTELRVVDGILYAKAPVTELAAEFGSGREVAELRKQSSAEVPAVGAFLDGKWVSLDVKEAAQGAAGLPAEDLDTKKALAELRTSATNLIEGATVVRDPADPEHLTVTSSTGKAYAEVKRLVAAVGGPLGGDLPGTAPKDRPVVLDLWVDNGDLRAAEVNLLQFTEGATGRAAVRLEVATGEPIAAPEGATPIDPALIAQAGALTGRPA